MNLLRNQTLVRNTVTKNRDRNKAGDLDGYLNQERIRLSRVLLCHGSSSEAFVRCNRCCKVGWEGRDI